MFSKERLYQDLEIACKATQSAYVCYTDVHSKDADIRAKKIDDFVNLMQKFHKGLTREVLENSKFLCRDINGSYRINIKPYVENNAGGYVRTFNYYHSNRLGYSHTNHKKYAKMLYFFDDETFLERHLIYHEIGHLLQLKLKIFNFKQAKEKCLSQKDHKFPKSFYRDYSSYLMEAHADAFGYACMLLRAESRQERAQNTIYAYRGAGKNLLAGMKSDDLRYDAGMKHYADFCAQKATVKEVNSWFRHDNLSQYLNDNGDINFEALALKVREIVDKNAMSPNVFYNFLHGNFWSNFSLKEKNWQTSVPQAFLLSCTNNRNANGYNKVIKKIKHHKEIERRKSESAFVPLKPYSEESEVLNTCCELENLYIKFAQAAAKEDIDITKYKILDTDNAIKYGKIPSHATDTFVAQLNASGYNLNDNFIKGLHKYIENVNWTLHFNKADKNLVLSVMQSSDQNNRVRDMMWQMYYARRENPQAKVDLEKLQIETEPLSVKKIHKQELKIFDMLSAEIVRNDAYETLASTPEEAHKMRAKIINLLPTLIFAKGSFCPDKVVDDMMEKVTNFDADAEEKLRLSLKKACTLHYTEGSVFESAIARYYQSLQNLNNKNLAEKSANNRLNKNSYNER